MLSRTLARVVQRAYRLQVKLARMLHAPGEGGGVWTAGSVGGGFGGCGRAAAGCATRARLSSCC